MVRIFVSQPLQASGSGSSARYGRRATRRQRRFATVGRNLTRQPTLEGVGPLPYDASDDGEEGEVSLVSGAAARHLLSMR